MLCLRNLDKVLLTKCSCSFLYFQAFAFASENLDAIGLPLTPKLAENIRPKLKGCEAEVAALLDMRWKALAYEWTLENEQDIHIPSRPTAAPRSLADDRRV